MPGTKPAEEQRADLLEAGRALFLSKGVAATSLEDITSYREQHDLHEVLFRHGGHVSAGHHATHALVLQAISDLLASGVAAGAFDVDDPDATAVFVWASAHGFDPGFAGHPAPADDRLVPAAKHLFRRASGLKDRTRPLSPQAPDMPCLA